jgi:hypothetical protein
MNSRPIQPIRRAATVLIPCGILASTPAGTRAAPARYPRGIRAASARYPRGIRAVPWCPLRTRPPTQYSFTIPSVPCQYQWSIGASIAAGIRVVFQPALLRASARHPYRHSCRHPRGIRAASARYPRGIRAEGPLKCLMPSGRKPAASSVRSSAGYCRILPDSTSSPPKSTRALPARYPRVTRALPAQHQWRLFASRAVSIRTVFLPAGLSAPACVIRVEVSEDGPASSLLSFAIPGTVHCAEVVQLKPIAAASAAPNVTKSVLKSNI